MKDDTKGMMPDSWLCVDCRVNTAPGIVTRAELAIAIAVQGPDGDGVRVRVDDESEVYTVKNAVWKRAGMEEFGGCLCIGCLEKRIGRQLRPKDFDRSHPFADLPGTERLLHRRDG